MRFRLQGVAPDLVDRLLSSPQSTLRQVTHESAALAVKRVALVDPRVEAARAVLRQGQFGNSPQRQAVKRLTEELDNIQWDLQEQVDEGSVPQEDYLNAFARARAASALWFALDEDPLVAAIEALYEANAAVGNVDAVRALVDQIMSS